VVNPCHYVRLLGSVDTNVGITVQNSVSRYLYRLVVRAPNLYRPVVKFTRVCRLKRHKVGLTSWQFMKCVWFCVLTAVKMTEVLGCDAV
jgi:hypothetical protein